LARPIAEEHQHHHVHTLDTYQRLAEQFSSDEQEVIMRFLDGLIREHEGRRVPVTLFTKGGGLWLEAMADTGCDAVGLDWTVDIAEARRRVGHKVALQGNMDPSVLYAPAGRIEEEVRSILAAFGEGSGHVFNLGHGIHQDVPEESPKVLVDAVHQLSKPYHR